MKTNFRLVNVEAAPTRHSAMATLLATMGVAALALGLLVYLTERSPPYAALVPTVPALAGRHLFGVLGQWLPSFAHTLAFSLFSAAALGPRAMPRYEVCFFWCAVNIAFELGQHPRLSQQLSHWLQIGFGDSPVVRSIASYFVRGTFDFGDIAAAALGALAAAAILRLMANHSEHEHAQ